MQDVTSIIIVLGTAVVLPITLFYLNLKSKMESERNKKEIILSALEKNASIDIEELVRKMNAPRKLLKEKLLQKFQWGLSASLLGVIFIFIAMCNGYFGGDSIHILVLSGAMFLAIGVAFMISYGVGKKMLAKEIESEEMYLRLMNKQ